MNGSGLRDRWLWAALVVGLLLRFLPIWIWGDLIECTRDECIFKMAAEGILDGEGMTTSKKGWLAAPAYPYLMAFSIEYLGQLHAIKWVQLAISAPMIWMMYRLGWRLSEWTNGEDDDPPSPALVARLAAWMMAIHPTFVFYTGTMWTETFYSFFLVSATLATLWSREGSWPRSLVVGFFVACCMLLRGAALFVMPIYFLAEVWPKEGVRTVTAALKKRWRHGVAMTVAGLILVAPYSYTASNQHGGFVITDATVGHVSFLGNSDFPPLTFDYGNGMLTGRIYSQWLRQGDRHPCNRTQPAAVSNRCEVKNAAKWATENPGEFLGRVPLRLAQLFNPHSFFTRHLRWGYWPGFPWELKELLVLYIAATTYVIVLGGTVFAWARARGPYAVIALGVVGYHVATIAALYGMTRFRLPLEPFWMLFLAMFLATPKGTVRDLVASRGRLAGAVISCGVLIYLMNWFLMTGFPGF